MEDRQSWLNRIFESVQSVADRRFQEQAWFGKSYLISSPDEAYCGLFDDSQFNAYLQEHRSSLSPHQVAVWLDLQIAMDQFQKDHKGSLDPYVVFRDPRWRQVQEAASAFLRAFDQPIEVLVPKTT
jgi:hypothetical protein